MLPKGRWRVRAEGAWETSRGRRSGEVEWVGREEEEEVTPKRRVARDGEPESEREQRTGEGGGRERSGGGNGDGDKRPG